MKNIKLSTLWCHIQIGTSITLEQYVEAIRDGAFKESTEKLREKIRLGPPKEADQMKRNLKAVLPHGIFTSREGKAPPIEYSQLLAIDIDHLKDQGIIAEDFKRRLSFDPHIICAHLTCSGDGMVLWIKHSGDVSRHSEAVDQVCDYVEYNYQVDIDRKVSKGINNQRFCSYDPDAYVNWDAIEFDLLPKSVYDLIQDQRKFTDQKEKFEPGNRNQWLFLFANNCNRTGISKSDLLVYANRYLQSKDFEMEEISRTVNSAYKNEIPELEDLGPVIPELFEPIPATEMANGKNGKDGNVAISHKKVLDFKSAPTFPSSLLDNLPELLKKVAATGETQIEQDLAVLAAMTGLSSLLPNLELFYDHVHYPNIFTMILANAGEGKSKVSNVIKMFDPLHMKMVKDCSELKARYKLAKKQFDNCDDCTKAPESPSCKGIFVSEDITHASLLDKLASKSQYNLLFSTEIDSVNRTMSNETFNKTDLFRKTFHHEMISHSRRADELEIQIPEPKLSILITGTPGTINGMVKSVEDGTASRFIYYGFASSGLIWKSQQSEAKVKADSEISKLSKSVEELFEFTKDRPIKFDFTEEQKLEFDKYFEDKTSLLDPDADVHYFASVKRHGLIFKRIAAILTAVEAFENKNSNNELICSDKTFGACKDIIDTLLEHSKIVFSNLEQRPYEPLQDNSEKLLQALPDEFTPRLGYKISEDQLGITERTARNYYKKLVQNKKLVKVGPKYQKLQIAAVAVASAVAVDAIETENLLNNN